MAAHALEDMLPIFTHADARARGVSDRVLYGWRDRGLVDQLARGIFVQPDLPADPDLVEIAVRAPDATLCLTTALARHHLIDDIPPTIDVALPRGQRPPRTTAESTRRRVSASPDPTAAAGPRRLRRSRNTGGPRGLQRSRRHDAGRVRRPPRSMPRRSPIRCSCEPLQVQDDGIGSDPSRLPPAGARADRPCNEATMVR